MNPNDYPGSDNERIQAAIAARRGPVVIPARVPDATAPRDYWLLDHAILLPAETTLILENCRLKLSDRCRDNFIRSANCGAGIHDIQPLRNIHITGVGTVVLEGADRPRASGDAAKKLSRDAVRIPGAPYRPLSYGTDDGKADEKQTGDWRNIGILLASVEQFSIRNLKLQDAHSWAISLERCAFGEVRDVEFAANAGKVIDGEFRTMLNQDGLDVRQGCHDITIENITGHSGDDLIALTGIAIAGMQAGDLASHMVSGMERRGECDDMHDIQIRNIRGSAGGYNIVLLLNTSGIKMYRILLDGLTSTGATDASVVRIGDRNPAWGGVTPLGDTFDITITNVRGQARTPVAIHGSLCDSVIRVDTDEEAR